MFLLRSLPLAAVLALTAGAAPGFAAGQQASPAPLASGYADLADLVLAAPIVADATIVTATRIKGAEAAALGPGLARFYVEADVFALIRGSGGVPPRIGYVVDVPIDADGRPPRLKKARVLVFARTVAGTSDQVQLVAPDAQIDWSPAADSRARGIAAAAFAADAPPSITGIANAFHVPGSLPGEGETQIFLATADKRPVSLTVLRRPGEQPRWAVALSEIVDEAAAPPGPETMLWYRLACALPPSLPARATASLAESDAAQAQVDYRFVIESLRPCGRTRASRRPSSAADQPTSIN